MTQVKQLNGVEDWEKAFNDSVSHPLFVFKHSTACPISATALKEFQAYLDDKPDTTITYAIVKVIEARNVSNRIADDVGVKHESPQAIIVGDKQAIWNDSHLAITASSIRNALGQHT